MRHLAILLALSCGPKRGGVTTPASSSELGSVADHVVAALPGWRGFATYAPEPRIVVLPTENRTKFRFDTKLATAKLVNGLIRGAGQRFVVIDPEAWAALRAEASAAAKAAAAEGAEAPPVSVDQGELLMLHSEVRTTDATAEDGREAIHVLVTYRLVEAETARALWAWSTEWTRARGEEGFEAVSWIPPEIASEPEPEHAPPDEGEDPDDHEPHPPEPEEL